MTVSSGLAVLVSFLIILLTMYTMVLERTREIGVLKSLGMTSMALLRLSTLEGMLVSAAGVAIGIGLAHVARGVLGLLKPLLTVDLSYDLLLSATLIGLLGGLLAAAYPGYRAARLDPAIALSYE